MLGSKATCVENRGKPWWSMILHQSIFFYDTDPLPFCSALSWVKHFVGTCMEQKHSHKLEIIMADGKPWFMDGYGW